MGGKRCSISLSAKPRILSSFTVSPKQITSTHMLTIQEIYGASSIDKATMNAYTQTRKFLMHAYGVTEIEANTLITQAVDFAMTQLVDGNWGVHSVIPKKVFETGLKKGKAGKRARK